MIEIQEEGAVKISETICDYLKGEIVTIGKIEKIFLESKGGFDVGKVIIEGNYEITFWNEYMTLEKEGERIATFPDIIMTIDASNGEPLSSAKINKGQNIIIIRTDRNNLKLGAGMRFPELFKPCEDAVGKKIIDYIF